MMKLDNSLSSEDPKLPARNEKDNSMIELDNSSSLENKAMHKNISYENINFNVSSNFSVKDVLLKKSKTSTGWVVAKISVL